MEDIQGQMTLSDRLQGPFELESNFWTSDRRQWSALSFARVNSLNPWSTGSQLAAHENGVPGVPPPSLDRTPWVPKPRPPGKTLSSSSSFASDTNLGPGLSLRSRLGLPSGSGQPSASGALRDSTSGPNPGPMSAAAEIESWAGEGALAPRSLEAVAPVKSREGGGVWWESGSGPMKQYSVRQRRMREGHVVQEFAITDCERKKPPLLRLLDFSKSYVLPEGFPHSVAPCYTPYMQWRFVQYFFGGAIGVFSTRSLLYSLGLSNARSTSGALAVNWIIKDGAGRFGKLIFARHGKKFDSDLKQFRFGASILMDLGAGVELSTLFLPKLFLPLACLANVAKNVAGVTYTSTRAPIYRTFALRDNLGDVTAKGESVSNLADLLGVGLGIALTRNTALPLAPAFCLLSAGYLLSSFREVKVVELPTLNRSRFRVAVNRFLETGRVPSISEGNRAEKLLVPPWVAAGHLRLGASVEEAFETPEEFRAAANVFVNESYVLSYRAKERRTCVVLKQGAKERHVLKGTFQAHLVAHLMQRGESGREAVQRSCEGVEGLLEEFERQAKGEGWLVGGGLLSPTSVRLWEERPNHPLSTEGG